MHTACEKKCQTQLLNLTAVEKFEMKINADLYFREKLWAVLPITAIGGQVVLVVNVALGFSSMNHLLHSSRSVLKPSADAAFLYCSHCCCSLGRA